MYHVAYCWWEDLKTMKTNVSCSKVHFLNPSFLPNFGVFNKKVHKMGKNSCLLQRENTYIRPKSFFQICSSNLCRWWQLKDLWFSPLGKMSNLTVAYLFRWVETTQQPVFLLAKLQIAKAKNVCSAFIGFTPPRLGISKMGERVFGFLRWRFTMICCGFQKYESKNSLWYFYFKIFWVKWSELYKYMIFVYMFYPEIGLKCFFSNVFEGFFFKHHLGSDKVGALKGRILAIFSRNCQLDSNSQRADEACKMCSPS